MITIKCHTCNRDPERMNSHRAECSHVDCPNRRKAWSEQPTGREHKQYEQVETTDSADPIPLDVELAQRLRY